MEDVVSKYNTIIGRRHILRELSIKQDDLLTYHSKHIYFTFSISTWPALKSLNEIFNTVLYRIPDTTRICLDTCPLKDFWDDLYN
jgi:hypothetical protein